MEAPAFQTGIQFPGLFGFRSVAKPKKFKVAAHKNLHYKLPSVINKTEPRRSILRLIGINLIFANVCAALAAPVQEMREPEVISIQDPEARKWCEDTRHPGRGRKGSSRGRSSRI